METKTMEQNLRMETSLTKQNLKKETSYIPKDITRDPNAASELNEDQEMRLIESIRGGGAFYRFSPNVS